MEKISWTDYVRNEEVLIRVSEQRNILHEIRKRKANCIGHVLRRNCLLKVVIEGKIEGRIEVTRRRKKMLDDLGDRRGNRVELYRLLYGQKGKAARLRVEECEVGLHAFSTLTLERGAVGIQITDLRVPSAVRNNSGSAALLDCEYTLKPEELAADKYSGLVVKWYFKNSPSPVYQWIPGQKPQDLGILKGKLDLSHRASDHGATMHRALYITNPTTELSGEYKCFVSTFDDEDFMTKKMVVFGK
ncbi:hypothetical protein B7P43_G16272 [Cryptotermes secundus]|uniref:Ig-like domain-containing protein n=1 Tax=Cryptotermes secundus TaxID=105785 RepID=A0A2J7QE53_9NEOP|nr:hypothetical protein B7P43_G16272 [Cryptotermes secundus]